MSRTTFRLDEELLAEAKALAARQHRTLNSVMEEALRRMLAASLRTERRDPVRLTTYGRGGPQPGVDLSPAGIKRILGEDDDRRFAEG